MDGGGHIWFGNYAIRGGVESKHLGDLSYLGTYWLISREKLRQHLFANGSIGQVLDYNREMVNFRLGNHYRLFSCLPCLPWSLSSARSCRGASWRTSSSAFSTPAGCVTWLVSLRRMCRSAPRCCQSSSSSAYPLFACLRLFPEVSFLFRPSNLVTCLYHLSCSRRFNTVARRSSYGPIWFLLVLCTCSLVIRSLYEMPSIHRKHLDPCDRILLCSSAAWVLTSHMHK